MDIGKRLAETASVVAAVFLVGDVGDKHGWWTVTYLAGIVEYGLPLSILVALGLNTWVLHRHKSAPPSAALTPAALPSPEPVVIAASNRKNVVPTVGITLRETAVEAYDNTPGRHYPRKLRLYCSNDGDDIHLGIGKWIAGQVGLQAGKPPACSYEMKNHLGKFSDESSDKFIPSGKWFRLYVGIDSTVSDKDLTQMTIDRSFGILEIPAEVGGVPVKVRICP